MNAGVSLYSFHEYASDRVQGVKDCIRKAYEMGATGLDFIEVGLSYDDYLSYAADVRRYCHAVGVEPVCFCTGADFLRCEDIKEEIAKVKRNVDIALAYGCKILRHDISRGFAVGDERTYDDAIEIVAPAAREIACYAEERGIVTCTENHGFFSQDSDRVEKLILAVNEKNFGALVDIGNFACSDADHAYAVGVMAPYAFHAHAKDFHKKSGNGPFFCDGFFKTRGGTYLRGAIIGHGDVPVYQCLSTLVANGYDGFVTVEFEGIEDQITGTTYGLNTLKKIFSTL